MYERFFNLSETPFSIAPNPHYLYMSQQHNEALAHLVYGVGRDGGVVLLTGEVGTGKTTVCRCFLEQIPEDTDVAFVLNPKLKVDELLATICDELSIPYIGDSISVKDYIDCINGFLLRQHANGRHTVLIIDEAQNLSSDVLEQIRLLTNLETHEKKLLQIVLLGQPELQDMFKQSELRQLSQRVTARFHLNALTEKEVGPYVYHRLTVAGAVDPKAMFNEAVIHRLYQISQGIPRVINLICDRCMLGAYAKSSRVIDIGVMNAAATEVLGYDLNSPVQHFKRSWGSAALGLLVGVLLMTGYSLITKEPEPETPKVVEPSQPEAQQVTDQTAQTEPAASTAVEKTPSSRVDVPPPVSVVSAVAEPSNSAPQLKPDVLSVAQVYAQTTHASYADAYGDLFVAWGLDYDPENDGMACDFAEQNELSCLSKLGSLGSIKHYGLPAILRLFDAQGEQRYVVVRRIEGDLAQIYLDGVVKQVDLVNLDNFWRGHFSLLWKKPPDYHGRPLRPGNIAPLSKWLSYQLDVWERKAEPSLGRSTYDEELVARVKSFQRYVGEMDDGIVGVGTLIQLSRRTDKAIPLLNPENGGS